MVVTTWTKREVRALRKSALRLTQEKFGEHVGYSTAAVGKWEQATKDRPVRGDSAHDLDTVLANLDATQLARFEEALDEDDETSRSSPAPPDAIWHLDVQGHEVKRREFGRMIAAGAVAVAIPDHFRIGMNDAHRLSDIVDGFIVQDQQQGGDSLLEAAKRVYTRARTMLETYEFDQQTGAAFTAATGRMAMRVGWLAYDTDNHELANRYYSDALALGAQCGNDGVTAHACMTMALQALKLNSPERPSARHALRLIARVKDLTHGSPPGRIHALAAVREARAYAALGDRAGFARSMGAAWREMDYAAECEPVEECPTWLRFMSHAEVRFHEAMGHDHLGDDTRAIEGFAEVLNHASGPRNRANHRAVLAGAMARAGDVSGAVGEAMQVFDVLGRTVSSKRTLAELTPVREATTDRFSDFNECYDRLLTGAPA